ncbi:MAG TPA: response regulator [Vicinamibacterales bacterium]|nr:response regulator [Vicinamibacterales bacterium]
MASILIVDDDPTVGMTFARILEGEGHSVTRVETASDGLSHLEAEAPDAVILDMRMPLMGGLDFLRKMRRDDRLSRCPVGIVTGDYFLKDDVLAELTRLGASVRYKPLWMDDLRSLTQALLDGDPISAGQV